MSRGRLELEALAARADKIKKARIGLEARLAELGRTHPLKEGQWRTKS